MGIDLNGIKFFGSLSDFPEALGICIFQYIWHFNHVAIYRSLENKREINKVVASGSVLAYTLICVLSVKILDAFFFMATFFVSSPPPRIFPPKVKNSKDLFSVDKKSGQIPWGGEMLL